MLAATGKQRLSKGIKVQVRGVRAGDGGLLDPRQDAQGKIVKLSPYTARSVTVKATGAKLRSLKRAVKAVPLTAEITVRTFSGKTPVTTNTTVIR